MIVFGAVSPPFVRDRVSGGAMIGSIDDTVIIDRTGISDLPGFGACVALRADT